MKSPVADCSTVIRPTRGSLPQPCVSGGQSASFPRQHSFHTKFRLLVEPAHGAVAACLFMFMGNEVMLLPL